MNLLLYLFFLLIFTIVFWFSTNLFRKGVWFIEPLSIFLYILFFSIGIAALTLRFSLVAKYNWLYYIIGAILCFNINGVTVLYREEEIKQKAKMIFIFLSVLFYGLSLIFLTKISMMDYFIIFAVIFSLVLSLVSKLFKRKI